MSFHHLIANQFLPNHDVGPNETLMTDKTPKDAPASDQAAKPKSNTGRNAAIGAAATIGSAAIAAALLYVGRRSKKTMAEEPPKSIPSGEKPETD